MSDSAKKVDGNSGARNREDRQDRRDKKNGDGTNRDRKDRDAKSGDRAGSNPTYVKRDYPKHEPLFIPPVPENMGYDYFDYDYEDDDENGPMQTTSLIPEIKEIEENVEEDGLKYDVKLNKYWEGRKLKLPLSKTLSMMIGDVDAEGYVYLIPNTDDSIKMVAKLKLEMAAVYIEESIVSKEDKRYNFDELMRGEIVVVKVRGQEGKTDYIRARVIDICTETKEATVVDADTMTRYLAPKNYIYRAYASVMRFPFQARKFRLKKLQCFEGTGIARRLFKSSHFIQNPPAAGYNCSWDDITPGNIPEVKIGLYQTKNWDFEDHLARYFGAVLGAKYHLTSGLYIARICGINEEGNIWLHYKEDTFMSDKMKSLLDVEKQFYEKKLIDPLRTMPDIKMSPPSVFITRLNRNNLCRVVIHRNRGNETMDDEQRILVECIDTGNLFFGNPDELIPLEQFTPMLQNIPAMCQRVTHVGVKSLSKAVSVEMFERLEFNVEICSEWPNDEVPIEVRMTICNKSKKTMPITLDTYLTNLNDPGIKFYSESERELIDEERRKLWEEKQAQNKKKYDLKNAAKGMMPSFVENQLQFAQMNPFEQLKGPYNGSYSGLSATPWLDLSVDGNNAEWTRREYPLDVKSLRALYD